MKRYLPILLAVSFTGALLAQSANPLSTEAKQAYTGIKNNLLKMAEKMPEADYSFKASPDIRTFGQLVGHVADANARICSTVAGESKAVNAASKTSKADLVAALKEAFAICDPVYDSLTDAGAKETVKFRGGERTRLGVLNLNTAHDNEEYGYMAVYMRIKGQVPPSSERR